MPTSQSASDTEPPSLPLRRWALDAAQAPVRVAERAWRIGAGPDGFLLKAYPAPDRRRMAFRHRVTAALDAAGLPVLAPVPSRAGRTLVVAGGTGYVLYPWVAGRRRGGLELTYAQCERLGELLGLLHAALDEHTPPVQQEMLVSTPRAADAVAEIDRLLAAVPHDGTDFAALTGRRLAERRALLVEFADHQPPELDVSTVGHLHGAFDARRLRYGGSGNVTAVLGWDALTTGPVAGEVVRAAASLFATGDERGLDLERVRAFVRGHRSAFPLDAGQIQAAVHRAWWERLCDVAPLRHRYVGGEREPAGASALVGWWSAHLDLTLDAFPAAYGTEPVENPAYG
ncbi:Phosphotransferase enzyme family protein [Actinomadura rubteroloni]|uniref:Phosphotransferase enzyme family protein n=1 Tax=Actinomadura rubteroloni TaxID=1926885 RepID=A0A2P4UFC4_9ACTN|nr:phosphotransferase [Actinomadura rubteroloni]POM23731.1 Phosphotransferase enzyme family protein [Actinomadura rubteroloni]